MWCSTIIIIEIYFPYLILHDYPKELQEVIDLPTFTNRKNAYIFQIIMIILILAFIFWSGVYTYRENSVSYWVIFSHIFTVCMCWNIFDLIVMDWLIFCTW